MKIRLHVCQILFLTSLFILQSCENRPEVKVHIYVASSLEESVRCLNTSYKRLYPKRKVSISVLGSQSARLQIERGAPAGIFISAAKQHIDVLKDLHFIVQSQILASNQVILLTHKNSSVHHLEDLIKTKSLGIAAQVVPIGHYSWRIIEAQSKRDPQFLPQIQKVILSHDLSSKSLKGRALRGEVESVFLYRSDLQQMQSQFREVSLQVSLNDLGRVQLYIALTRRRAQDQVKEADLQWYKLMLSKEGQNCLQAQGIFTN
ncbi:MAG: hypothetical protein CMH49_05670 [Myxococcales bacterium]|nr:hypothetical protein [Myxococcales bacterium]